MKFALAHSSLDGYQIHKCNCADLKNQRGRHFSGKPEIIEATSPEHVVQLSIEDLEASGFEKGEWRPVDFRIMPCARQQGGSK